MSVDRAVQSLGHLYQEVQSDLDTEGGGIRWLQGQLDWQRASLIGDYYMSAILGVQTSIQAAEQSAQRYRRREFSDNHWLSSRWTAARTIPGATPSDYLAAIVRGPAEADRELEMTTAAEQCLFHLAQALDRVAVCIAVTGGFRLELLKVDWTMLAKIAEKGHEPGHELRRQPPAGLDKQRELLTLMRDEPADHGPMDWLAWLLRARNTVTHRPPKTLWAMLTSDKGRDTGLSRPFHRQPGWAEMEALLRTERAEGLFGMVLEDEPASTLDGLTASTSSLLEALSSSCVNVVQARRQDPSVLVQNGRQWPDYFDQPLLHFPGYGNPPKVRMKNARFHVSPDSGDRLNAFRLGDRWASDWKA